MGSTGPIELYFTTSDILQVPPHFVLNDLTAECPNGMHVVSGGHQSVNHEIVITRNAPNRNFQGWQISAYNNSDVPVPIQTYAICVPSELIPVAGISYTGSLEAIQCEYPNYPPSHYAGVPVKPIPMNAASAPASAPANPGCAAAQRRYAPMPASPRRSC